MWPTLAPEHRDYANYLLFSRFRKHRLLQFAIRKRKPLGITTGAPTDCSTNFEKPSIIPTGNPAGTTKFRAAATTGNKLWMPFTPNHQHWEVTTGVQPMPISAKCWKKKKTLMRLK